jgi:hypothetical protein
VITQAIFVNRRGGRLCLCFTRSMLVIPVLCNFVLVGAVEYVNGIIKRGKSVY